MVRMVYRVLYYIHIFLNLFFTHYKAFTEYFIHNDKNSLPLSESILNQLASLRMETGLPTAFRQDKNIKSSEKI